MACKSSNLLLHTFSHKTSRAVTPISSCKAQCPKAAPPLNGSECRSRRHLLFFLTATTALKAVEMPSKAEDIGLFGLRKKLKKVEDEAEEIVKEGIESAEKGIEAAEKGIGAAEKGLEKAEKEIETEVSSGFGGDLGQAGVVAGAELVGVLVATSIVNGILGPESQKS